MENEETLEQFYKGLFKEILDKEYTEKPIRGGAARTFANPKVMAEKAVEYFSNSLKHGYPITFEGLRVHMHLWRKENFYHYANDVKQYKEDFKKVTDIIRAIIERKYVEELFGEHTSAARFVLSCNYGWVPAEKHIVENHNIEVNIGKKPE